MRRVMRQMYDTLLADVNASHGALSADDPPPSFVRLFVHVAEHQQFYKLMFCGEGMGRFQKLVKDYIAEQNEIKMNAMASDNQSLAVPPAMYAQFLSGAFIGILTWWLENDLHLSPRQMAQHFLSMYSSLPSHC